MLEKLYDLLMSIITFILGLFGCEFGKKSVTFAEGTKDAVEESSSKEEDKTVNVDKAE